MTIKKSSRVSISERALLGRIQRKLKTNGQKLVKCRPDTAAYAELGSYYITDGRAVIAQHRELEVLGRELGVLKPYEKLED